MEIFIKYYVPIFMAAYFTFAIFLKSYLLYKRTGINPVTFGKKGESAHDYIGFWFKLILIGVFVYAVYFTVFAPQTTFYLKVLKADLSNHWGYLNNNIFNFYAVLTKGNGRIMENWN